MYTALDLFVLILVAAVAFFAGWNRAMAHLSPEFAKFLRRYDP